MKIKKRVLITDDAQNSRDLLRFILESSGLEVVEASHGEEMLQKAELHFPHLFLLDLNMPRGDGWSVIRELRQNPSFETTPVIALIATLSQANPAEFYSAGFSAFLVKPITPASLRRCVAKLLYS